MRVVYLAGSITGKSYEGATDWREQVKRELNPGIVGLSPMRATEYLQGVQEIAKSYEAIPISSARGIITRDFYDVKTCDMLLANLVNTEIVSIGTVIEIGWAYALRKPLILVTEEGSVYEHPMVTEACSYRVNTLDQGIALVNAFLTDLAG